MPATAQIKTCFFLTSDEFDLDVVTAKMGVTPTETRTKDSFPPAGLAHTGWAIEIVENNCVAVSIPFEKLLKVLEGKEEIINQLCKDYNLEAGLEVVVHMQDGNHPEIVIPSEVSTFASRINAEIGFDIYWY